MPLHLNQLHIINGVANLLDGISSSLEELPTTSGVEIESFHISSFSTAFFVNVERKNVALLVVPADGYGCAEFAVGMIA
jgi:hypothetical protein